MFRQAGSPEAQVRHRNLRAALVFATLASATSSTSAGPDDDIPLDGEFLYQSCSAGNLSYAQGFCRGYVRGIWDSVRDDCPATAEEPTNEQLAQVVTGYLAALPKDQRSLRIFGVPVLDYLPDLVARALRDAWNCSK